MTLEQLRDAVWALLRMKLGDTYNWSIYATYSDSVVVQTFPAQFEQYPLTVNADDTVTLGEPTKVKMVFEPFRAMAESKRDGMWLGCEAQPAFDEAEMPAELREQRDLRWSAVLIAAGRSANGRIYPAAVLAESVQLFENARSYWTHAASQQPEPDPRNIAGFFRGCKFALLENKGAPQAAIVGTFYATDGLARARLREAFDAGNPSLFGLSINARGRGKPVRDGENSAFRVDAIEEVRSVDVVSNPAAGGGFMAPLTEGASAVVITTEVLMNLQGKLEALRRHSPAAYAKLPQNATEQEVDAALCEALATASTGQSAAHAAATAAPAPIQAATPAATTVPLAAAVPVPPAATRHHDGAGVALSEAERSLLEDVRAVRNTQRVDAALAPHTLPETARAHVRNTLLQLVEGGATDEHLRAHVAGTVAMLAPAAAPQPAGSGIAGTASVGQGRHNKLYEALEEYFWQDAHPQLLEAFKAERGGRMPRRQTSFRKLYVELTGDTNITGMIHGRKELQEATALLEALDSQSWPALFGSIINQRMLAQYRLEDAYSAARQIVSNWGQPLNDFTNAQRLTRFGSYADLQIVGERQPYPDLQTPGEEMVQYLPAKRGGIESISREAILADQMAAIRGLPIRIGNAARRGLFKFIMDFVITNPTIYDGVALFAAGHNNIYSDDLSPDVASRVYTTMGMQRDMSGNDYLVGNTPKTIICHPSRHEMAWRIVNGTQHPTEARNATEANYVKTLGYSAVITNPYLTDINQWFVVGDPSFIPTIEIGFVGSEEPELLVQDNPGVGTVFTADVISWKVRFGYGGALLDYRGFVGRP